MWVSRRRRRHGLRGRRLHVGIANQGLGQVHECRLTEGRQSFLGPVDEFDYLGQTGGVPVGGINDDRGRGDGNPLERRKRLLERIQIQNLCVGRSTRLGGGPTARDP